MSKRRVRTHANPLSYPEPILREEWESKIGSKKPLYVDMGCGQGDFLVSSALQHPERNYVGIEVRAPMCDKVNERITRENVSNAICVSGNASISLRTMFKEKEVQELYIQFPDPWIKEKHHKRRMIKEDVVTDLKFVLADSGMIHLISDVKEVYDNFYFYLSKEFIPIMYIDLEEKSYWHKHHLTKRTELYASCFKK